MPLVRDQTQTSGHLEVYLIHYPPNVLGQRLCSVYIVITQYNGETQTPRSKQIIVKPSCWIVI